MDQAVVRPAGFSPGLYSAVAQRRDAAALATLFVWTLIVGLPILRIDYPDDAFYSEAAHLWTQGLPPYLGVFDIKPPGYFALLALVQMALGPTLAAIHGLSLACDMAAAMTIYAIGRTLDAPRAGFSAAATFIPLAVFLFENEAYPPLVLAETLAFWAALHPGVDLRRAALSGLACGVAISFKQTAVLEAAALAFFFARGRQLPAFLMFCLAMATVPLAFVAYFARVGGLEAMFQDVVVYALQRPGVQGATYFGGDNLLLSRLITLGPLVLLTFCVWLRLRNPPPGLIPAHSGLLRLWLLTALVELMAQGAQDLNYLSEAAPPALLLACLYAERGGSRGGAKVLSSALVATVALFGFVHMTASKRGSDEVAMRQVAAMVEKARPRPEDRLLGLDSALWANTATNLAPPTPYFHRMHLLCAFPGAGADRLTEAFAARPRFLVVGARLRSRYDCAANSTGWSVIDFERTANYRPIGDVQGRVGNYVVYERSL